MKNWMTYQKIQELKRDKLNKSQVARKLAVDYKTVSKYWDMPPDGFAAATNRAARRRRKADDYEEYVLGLLRQYPDMSAAQIYDWIMEKEGCQESAVQIAVIPELCVWSQEGTQHSEAGSF